MTNKFKIINATKGITTTDIRKIELSLVEEDSQKGDSNYYSYTVWEDNVDYAAFSAKLAKNELKFCVVEFEDGFRAEQVTRKDGQPSNTKRLKGNIAVVSKPAAMIVRKETPALWN